MIMNKLSILLAYLICLGISSGKSPFTFYPHDTYEEIMLKMDSVNRDNCLLKSWDELTLPIDSVAMLPVFNSLFKTPWVANRSSLLHMHNMAMNRGFFYSYILQKLNTSDVDFPDLPGLHYYYLSASADVSANPGIINGSSVFFDTDCQYANWIQNLEFNHTLPLFGPKAWRLDDWNDEINWLRGEPTNFTIEIIDYGAGPNNNYTNPQYKFNPWMKDKDMQIDFMPDYVYSNARSHQTDFVIYEKYENGTISQVSSNFFGPPQPGIKEVFQPVRFTRPYFDCTRSKKWIVTAVGPVVDYMARYVPPKVLNVRRPRIVGVTTMDIDFLRIDFNPCPTAEGNEAHYFVNVARCKPTTMCEALFHFGFYRGGYQCNCKPGYRLPYYQNGPFQGVDIERATEDEYKSGFDCLPVSWKQVNPTVDGITDEDSTRKKRSIDEENIDPWNDETTKWLRTQAKKASVNRWNKLTVKQFGSKLQTKFIPPPKPVEEKPKINEREIPTFIHPKNPEPESVKAYRKKLESQKKPSPKLLQSRRKRSLDYVGRLSGFEPDKLPAMDKMINFINNVSIGNCKSFTKDQLSLPGEVGYGSETHFEMQGRVALRLAHFLSAYYQNNIKNEKYGNLRPGKTINREHLFGEVFANVMADLNIKSSGVFFDRQKFVDDNDTRKDLFGPYAYKQDGSLQAYAAIDLGSKAFSPYTENSWFKVLKERWGSNAYGLERFKGKPWIRSDINGSQIQRYFHYPLFYYAPRYQDGYWSNPYFDCDGFVPNWIMMYSAPFFGNVGTSGRVEFMGVVTVSVPLSELDINQCPSSFYTPNFFKNTATCDYRSTYCTPFPGRKFGLGNYKCECRQGFEYPFGDALWFYPGQLLEKEYRNKLKGIANRYDTLQCRESIGSRIYISSVLLCLSFLISVWRV